MRACKQIVLWPVALLLAAGSCNVSAEQSKPTPSTALPVRAHQSSLRWNELSAQRRAALSPLQTDWDKIEEDRQKKWLVIADKFSTMNPEQQARAQSRMREWVALKPEQRRIARESYLQAKKLDPAQKNAKWERYQQLPEDEKQRLAEAAAKKKRLAALPALPPAHTAPGKP
jgi:hypothetical protein